MKNENSTMALSSQSILVDNGRFEENLNRVGDSSTNLSSSVALSGMPNFSTLIQEQMGIK